MRFDRLMVLTLVMVVPWMFAVMLSGCATQAEFEYTENGFKIRGNPMSKIRAKHGDVEIEADSKFDILKHIVSVNKTGV